MTDLKCQCVFRSVQGCGAQRSIDRHLWGSGTQRWRQEPLQGQRWAIRDSPL